MLKQYGFKQEDAEKALNSNKHNQITTVYYLLHKRYEKQGVLPSHFNIVNKSAHGGSAFKSGKHGTASKGNSIDFGASDIKLNELGTFQGSSDGFTGNLMATPPANKEMGSHFAHMKTNSYVEDTKTPEKIFNNTSSPGPKG